MATSDKNIVITPNTSQTADPKIVFSGADASTSAQNITLQVYPTNNGTLSFEGSNGQLFSISNNMSGTIYSVNDISGIPSIEVLDSGLIKLGQYSGNIVLGSGTDNGNKLQVNGTIRNGSVWINNGNNYNAYNENIRLFAAPNNVTVIGFNCSGESGTSVTSLLGYSSYLETRVGSQWEERVYADYLQAYGSYRAPIFYDSNDTGYYCDPNSRSNFSSLNVGGSSISSGALNVYAGGAGGVGWGTGFNIGDGSNFSSWIQDAGVDRHRNYGTGGWDWYNSGGTRCYWGDNSGNSYAITSFRAPIFYDSDNTGYYCDPNSTSYLNNINAGEVYARSWHRNSSLNTGLYSDAHANHWYADSSAYWNLAGTNNSYCGIKFRPEGHQSTVRGYVYADTSNNIGFLNSSGNWKFRIISADYSLVEGSSIRAPLYYDSDNTGYYIDGNNTSSLNVVTANRFYTGYDSTESNSFSCSNWFRSNGGTGWYNGSYGGGIYMIDSTWVRVYNSKAFYVANEIAATGNITAYYSDERLKEKTGLITNALDKVCSLNAFYYVNNDLAKSFGYTDIKQQVGLSAQEVENILPEVVSLAPFDMETGEFDGTITSKSGENYKTLDYARLVPLLVEAIKEQQTQIETQNSQINKLEQMILELKGEK